MTRRKTTSIDQELAREEEKLRLARERLRGLEDRARLKQLNTSERRKRNHRLIEAAATIEAEIRAAGWDQFEIDSNIAGYIARAYLASDRGRQELGDPEDWQPIFGDDDFPDPDDDGPLVQ